MPNFDKTFINEAQNDPLVELLIAKMCDYFRTCERLAQVHQRAEKTLSLAQSREDQIGIARLEARGKALEELCLDLIRIYESRA